MLMVIFLQARRASCAIRATALCVSALRGASPRVSTTESAGASRAILLCPRYVATLFLGSCLRPGGTTARPGRGWGDRIGICWDARRGKRGTTANLLDCDIQIGYGSNKKTRHMMPSGHKAFLVSNVQDVELLLMHNKTHAAEYVMPPPKFHRNRRDEIWG